MISTKNGVRFCVVPDMIRFPGAPQPNTRLRHPLRCSGAVCAWLVATFVSSVIPWLGLDAVSRFCVRARPATTGRDCFAKGNNLQGITDGDNYFASTFSADFR